MQPDVSDQRFTSIRIEAEALYRSIGQVRCPYLHGEVHFNARGLEHLKFKALRRARPRHDQYTRLRLLHLAPQVLGASHTLQGRVTRMGFERERTSGRWQHAARSATYYEFVAIVQDVRVRVIVKQVGPGSPYFWSIIPFWKSDAATGRRLIHSGVPETD